jgi:hypothetical protein
MKRLEDRPPEGETQNVLDRHLDEPGQTEDAREHGAREDADAVAGNAMHGRSQGLSPARGDVLLMRPRQRLPATEHVEECADNAGICGQQHEPPFEHRRFRRVADVHRHEQQRRCRQQEPQQHHAIEHRALPRIATPGRCSARAVYPIKILSPFTRPRITPNSGRSNAIYCRWNRARFETAEHQ